MNLGPETFSNGYRLEEIGIAEKYNEIFYPDSKNDCVNTFERYKIFSNYQYYHMTMSTPDYYTLLDHTADLGIKVRGTDLIELFENAGKTLLHLMIKADPSEKPDSTKISLAGDDLADLMVRWLGEILYLVDGENLMVTKISIDSLTPTRLKATLETVPFDPKIHKIQREIKAVTYHQIDVAEKGDIWEARVIFDL